MVVKEMTEFELPISSDKIYLKEELRKILNTDKVKGIANAITVTMYPDDASLEDVEESIKIVLKDIQLRRKRENNKGGD